MHLYIVQRTSQLPSRLLNLESEPKHTGLVFLNHRLALLGRIVGLGEEHAVIAGGLLVLADAAGLEEVLVSGDVRQVCDECAG